MKNAPLPGRFELAVFVAMALVGGVLVTTLGQRDNMLFFVTMPVFLIAALLGFRRSLEAKKVEVKVEAEEMGSGQV